MNQDLKKQLLPPKAKKKNHFHTKFNDSIPDPYHWLSRRDSLEVLSYLKEENQYAEKKLEPLQALRKELFLEMKSRFPERENQEPVPKGDYLYYRAWEQQKPYPVHKRRKKLKGSEEEVLLDENSIKTDSGYKSVAGVLTAPNHNFLAYALDNCGREFYNIYFKDLKTGRQKSHFISSATSDFVWANDNRTVFYVQQDPKTLRAFQVYRFDIETGKKDLMFEESDLKFSVFLSKSLCESWIFIVSSSPLTTEYHCLPAHQPARDFALFCARELGHEYYLGYGDGLFYILSNKDQAFNFKLLQAKALQPSHHQELCPQSMWQEVIPHRPEVCIEDLEVFKKFIALQIRRQGRPGIEVFDRESQKLSVVDFPEKICSVYFSDNKEYKSRFIRIKFQSPTQPETVYDYELYKNKLHFKNQEKIKGGFKPQNYVSQEELALAEDGREIPISVVYKKGLKLSHASPLLLYAYGSYGRSMDMGFSSIKLSLLDRGFVYAVAHVRGGGEKGRQWHDEGRLLNKKNTFSDFIACAEGLIKKSYSSPSHLYIMGGSAGGLLIGNVLNERPELFRSAIASVPFVDCLTTMLDENIPLSTQEYEEWGNPNEKPYYDYIKSYSPYYNVKRANYPHILIETGYHDPRVQYWEPAKWTARLRDCKKDDNLLILLTNMKSGHFGSTGRLEFLKLFSLYYAFFIGMEHSLL